MINQLLDEGIGSMPRIGVFRGVSFVTALALLMAMLTVLAVSPVAAATAALTATLSGAEEVPPVATAATGAAAVAIDTDAASGAQLCYDVTSLALEGGVVIGAHIHEAAVGVNGPIVVTLTAVVTGNGTGAACAADADFDLVASGDPDIATLLTDIATNPANYYVNVHTTNNQGGEIRGQLAAAAAPTGMVMVMKHFCDASIQSEADFQAVEARAATNPTTPMGVPTLGSTTETVLACPVIVQPGDGQTPAAIGAGSMAFDFTTTDSTTTTQTLTTDTTFSGDNGFDTPVEDFACEDTVAYDADRDGAIEPTVCLDFSSYAFAGVVEGDVTVVETVAPPGARFGTVRLSPPEISDDAAVGLSFTSAGVMTFDSSADGDDMVTLHVYNFQAAAVPTPAASQLPDAAAEAPDAGNSLPLLVALMAVAFTVSGALVLRRRSNPID